MINDFIEFINESPTAYGATKSSVEMLKENGYTEYKNCKAEKGGKYYITRNDTSVIAFNVGNKLEDPSLHLVASHTDVPCFKLKPNPVHKMKGACGLNIEPYGGLLMRTWFDKPLSVAGRVIVNEGGKIASKMFMDEKPFCIIPSMAPHIHREQEAKPLSLPADITPVISLNDEYDFNKYLADNLGVNKEDVLSFDLYLYPLEKAYVWGKDNEFITGNHLDNLESVYTSLVGLIDNFNDNNINMLVAFDNEEVGSMTTQGADSDFLETVLRRVCNDLGVDYYRLTEQAMMISYDSAQALHPNHPEMFDGDNAPYLNKGVAVKFNAAQSYTSNSLSYAIFAKLLKDNDIPFQTYSNKTGIRGGGTLGGISNAHVSLLSVDIGLPVWAMHSSVETGGTKDIETSIDAISRFYEAHLSIDEDNNYSI